MDFHPVIIALLGLSVLELSRGTGQTDGQTHKHRGPFYNIPSLRGGGIATTFKKHIVKFK